MSVAPTTNTRLEQQAETDHRLKACRKKLRGKPLFIWFISLVEVIVFIATIAVNWSLTGLPIQVKPTFNPNIGPSSFVLIHMGARFSPCMKTIVGINDNPRILFPCPNYTGSPEQTSCTLRELCGFTWSTSPNQWYRFILPTFYHAGLLHIGSNLFVQLTIGAFVERKVGALRTIVIYFASSIFGIAVDGNFAPNGSTAVGCSSALSGLLAIHLLNILYDWGKHSRCLLIVLLIDLAVSFALGFLPFISNWAHIGGFSIGLILGVGLLAHPDRFRQREESDSNAVSTTRREKLLRYFSNRSMQWKIWWIVRLVCLAAAIVVFVLAIENFYSGRTHCSWCKYLDCLPVSNWCEMGELSTTLLNVTLATTVTTPNIG